MWIPLSPVKWDRKGLPHRKPFVVKLLMDFIVPLELYVMMMFAMRPEVEERSPKVQNRIRHGHGQMLVCT